MGWTTPKTWIAEVPTHTQFNAHIRDNFGWLHDPSHLRKTRVPTSDYTTTSATFTAVDSANLDFDVTSYRGLFELGFSLWATTDNASAVGSFTLTVEGVNVGNSTYGVRRFGGNQTHACKWRGIYVVSSGTPPLTLTVSLLWKSNSGHTLTVPDDQLITVWAIAH